jgi:hypothetical protein
MSSLTRELAERGARSSRQMPFLADRWPTQWHATRDGYPGGSLWRGARRLVLVAFGRRTGHIAGDGPHSGNQWLDRARSVDRAGEVCTPRRVGPPALMLRAAPDRCNAYANSHSWGSFLPRLSRDTLVPGATHCDFEDADDLVCAGICGAADPLRQATIRAEVAAAVDQWLK